MKKLFKTILLVLFLGLLLFPLLHEMAMYLDSKGNVFMAIWILLSTIIIGEIVFVSVINWINKTLD